MTSPSIFGSYRSDGLLSYRAEEHALLHALLTFQFRDDTLCQHFPQFHSPLIEAVDVPECPWVKDRVLVKRDNTRLLSSNWS